MHVSKSQKPKESPLVKTPLGALKTFDFVIKVAERCNLACNYCYYFYQDFKAAASAPPLIQNNTMAELPRFLARSVEELGLQKILVSLHGGEPTLMRKSRFDHLCGLLRQTLDNKVELKLAIQTNGTLIDDEWIDLFHKHRINVGISLDGNREIHDATRVDRKGKGSYDKAVGAIRRIQSKIAEGYQIGLGVIAVLHNSQRAQQLSHLVREIGVTPNLNLPRGGADLPEIVNWNANLAAHDELLALYYNDFVRPQFTFIRGISENLLPLISEKSMRWAEIKHAKSNFVATISSDGKLLIDDNLLGVDPSMGETELTIFDSSLADLIRSPQWQKINRHLDQKPAECHECRWHRVCQGGNVYNRYIKSGGYLNKSSLCDTIKIGMEKSFAYATQQLGIKETDILERLSRRPTFHAADAMEILLDRNVSESDFAAKYGDLNDVK